MLKTKKKKFTSKLLQNDKKFYFTAKIVQSQPKTFHNLNNYFCSKIEIMT